MTGQDEDNKTVGAWTFFGRILPERFPVTVSGALAGEIEQPDFGTRAKFRTVIHAGQLIVTLEVLQGQADAFTLRNLAAKCAEQYTDLVGYVYGGHLSVDIVSAVRDDEWFVFGIQIPAISGRQNPHRKASIDRDLIEVVGKSPHATGSLRDYQLAMEDPIGTGFYCYRAIEAMMQSMKSETVKDDKAAWGALNTALRLDRSAALFVKQYADYPRHGKPWSMSDADRVNVFEITDEVIYRYLEFLRRGSQALPSDEFSVLTAAIQKPTKKEPLHLGND